MILKPTLNIVLLLILLFVHCDTTEPPESKASLSLTLEDVSCTEAWITLKSTNLQIPNSITIKQNNQIRMTINSATADTLLYIDSLLPKENYSFTATTTTNNQQLTTNGVLAQTLDTTSHNFTWQTFTFGQHSSSVLYDVAIIDENNIWAVGEIYMNDSLGNPDPHAYNAVHWDGQSWELKRIMFYTICGQASLSSYPAKAIFAFSENDIWIAGGGRQLPRIDGINQVDKICLPFSMVINKIWGSSSNDLYAVGNGGIIAHYSNGNWTKIESGTQINLLDIWGSGDVTWICGWTDFNPTVLLKISSVGLTKVYEDSQNLFVYRSDSISGRIRSIWSKNRFVVFISTSFDLYKAFSQSKGVAMSQWGGPEQLGCSKNKSQ